MAEYKVVLVSDLLNIVVHSLVDYIPYDGTPRKKITTIALPVTIILSFLNICGIIFGVICLLFNVIYRKKRSYSEVYLVMNIHCQYNIIIQDDSS